MKRGLKEGNGILNYNSGDMYIRLWKNDKREGNGLCYLSSGDIYEGNWKNDKKHGKGIYLLDKWQYVCRRLEK